MKVGDLIKTSADWNGYGEYRGIIVWMGVESGILWGKIAWTDGTHSWEELEEPFIAGFEVICES